MNRPWFKTMVCVTVLAGGVSRLAAAEGPAAHVASDGSVIRDIWHVLSLADYNTRLVVLGTASLGVAAGLIGSFLLLRKRALMGDALSHATLPGICLAFMVMVAFGGTGKFFPGLLLGAAATGLLGVGSVMFIIRFTRLKDDAALGIVLSVFFGLGAALLGLIQDMPQGSAAGLESFIYGKTASIIHADLMLIVGVAVAVSIACVFFYKELKLLCFDDDFAASQGWPVTWLDLLMLSLVTAVTVIGLQAVGLILVIALLIIPPAAARFWTERLSWMMFAAALIGAACGWLGASLSAMTPKLPAGAVIVLVATAVFLFSMVFGASRGVVVRAVRHISLVRTVGRQHLLRAMFEIVESLDPHAKQSHPVPFKQLLSKRSWSAVRLRRLIASAQSEGLLARGLAGQTRLTERGLVEAARVARNHRLWEHYLITHADIAPSHVDRDADMIEHVLGPEMVAKLEQGLGQRDAETKIPPSPHTI